MSKSTTKFQVSSRPVLTSATAPKSLEQFAAGAAMVQSQTGGREVKPVRVNFDMTPDRHRQLKAHAAMRGISIADLLRRLIDSELA